MRTQIELDNTAAAELAGSGDTILRSLMEHIDCDVFLRGNLLTLEGDPEAVGAADGGRARAQRARRAGA